MQKIGKMIQAVAMPLAVLAIGGVVIHDHLRPGVPPPATAAVDGKALGRAYAPEVAATLGEAWLAAADSLERGGTVADSQAAFRSSWQDARARAFAARVAPEFARVLPEGAEPTDPARRAEVVRLWRDFASGLKGGR